jgi:hypothetical protein
VLDVTVDAVDAFVTDLFVALETGRFVDLGMKHFESSRNGDSPIASTIFKWFG